MRCERGLQKLQMVLIHYDFKKKEAVCYCYICFYGRSSDALKTGNIINLIKSRPIIGF